jgi:hypothetical protein
MGSPKNKMLPLLYQTILRKHLNESQYLTLQLLFLLLQAHRQVKLSILASVFPQPIQYQNRKWNLQRLLVLPQVCVKLLWFPLIKYWIRQEQTGKRLTLFCYSSQRKIKTPARVTKDG